MSPSGLGFGSDPSWRCQEERGHFAALLARGETPAELLPEPDPPGEIRAGLGGTSRLCFPGWGHSPAHLGMEIFISGCLVAQPLLPAQPPGGLWGGQGWGQRWLWWHWGDRDWGQTPWNNPGKSAGTRLLLCSVFKNTLTKWG